MSTPRQNGFTLIEIMVTVAIIGILSAVALPSYNSYLKRSRVPAALDALSAYLTRMEQRFQDTGTYANGAACAANLPTATDFTLSCTLSAANQNFTATATGTGRMAGYSYSINHVGLRRTVAHPKGVPVTNCWTTRGTVCDT